MKLVIFDCDGTIVDSQHAIVAAMGQAFCSAGLPVPERVDVVGVVGLSLATAIGRLLPEHDETAVLQLADRYKVAFADLRSRPEHSEPLFPGVGELIAALGTREDVALGIATGKSRRGVAVLLEREGLAPHFHTIQTADDHPSKPHPSMIRAAMVEAGAGRSDTVMIGDTTFDMEMARLARVAGLGVTWGYHPPDALTAAGARALARDCTELGTAIDRHLGGTDGAE